MLNWMFFPPMVGSFSILPLNTTVQEKGLRWSFPHLNATANTFLDSWQLCLSAHVLPSCWSSVQASTCTHSLKTMWQCYPKCLTRGKLSCLKKMYVFMVNTQHPRLQRGTVRPSFPGPFNTAQPEFICCKTKLTMLFLHMSLYTHAMCFVACTYEYETYGFIHDAWSMA